MRRVFPYIPRSYYVILASPRQREVGSLGRLSRSMMGSSRAERVDYIGGSTNKKRLEKYLAKLRKDPFCKGSRFIIVTYLRKKR